MLGPDTHQSQEVSILNRSIRWTANGLEYEADQRHVRVVLEQLELQDSKPVTTPFGPQEQGCPRDEGELLCGAEATKSRAIVARLNYLAMDRADIQYATKECAKRMANPRDPDWQLLKRVGGYLKGAPRAVISQPLAGEGPGDFHLRGQ